MQWRQITIVGAGLLGGSLAMAARRRQLARQVVGFVRRPETIKLCQQLDVFDRVGLDLSAAVAGADLVILCTPVGQMTQLVERMLPMLNADMLVTDVGSVKKSVVNALEPLVSSRRARFLGSHPMAGSEKSGIEAAAPDLFEGTTCAITPTSQSQSADVDLLAELWRGVGGRALVLSPDLHDQLVGRCSHLPHVVAASLVNLVLEEGRPPEQGQLCGPGFRDTTRIASGSPEMWRDICLGNQANLLSHIDDLLQELNRFRDLLVDGQPAALEEFFAAAQARRLRWTKEFNIHDPE